MTDNRHLRDACYLYLPNPKLVIIRLALQNHFLMKKLSTLLALFLLAGSLVQACTFIIYPFCTNVNENEPNLTILRGQIVAEIDNGVQFEIFEVLRGSESRTTVTIWDDSPIDCNGTILREAMQLGELGDSLIIAVPRITLIENAWEVLDDYRAPFSISNTSSLQIENNRVKGYISGSFQNQVDDMPYNDFISDLIEQEDCALLVDTRDPFLETPLNVFPNPASSHLFVEIPTGHQQLRYQIYNSAGQITLQGELLRSGIELEGLPKGLYLLAVQSQEGIFRRKKIIIQ